MQAIKVEWEFRAVNPPQDKKNLCEFRPASVPGVVQLDLMKYGDIPEPFVRDNFQKLSWMSGVNWEYRAALPNVPAGKKCRLVFEGIDTLSTVSLNGEILGKTDNMHRSYEFELTGRLTENQNTLTVLIKCPVKYAEEKFKTSGFKVSETQCHGSPRFYYPYVRKAAYSAGWDWLGYVPPAVGLWKNACLKIDSSTFILRDTNYRVELSPDFKEAEITAELEIQADENTVLVASLEVDRMELLPSHRIHLKKGFNKIGLRPVKIMNPLLWWPHGHGSQSLYKMTLHVKQPDNETVTDEKHIGIRKVRLLQPADEEGRKFVIEINGRKIFAKGGNWIPNDAYLPRVDHEKTESLVLDAAEANFNMLRTWGGGFYEDSRFFELCDRAGMMVWLDFPFACNLYPEDDEMISTIKAEVEENLKRIRNHASLVLLSGNNECHECNYVWLKTPKENKFYGRKIYEELLPEICKESIPEIPYVPGSPYTPDHPEDPSSPSAGDRHAWQLGFGIGNEKNYLHMTREKGRFISEFGYLGMPPFSTAKQFLDRHDLSGIHSDALASHQNTIVNMEMLHDYASFLYPVTDNLKKYCYLSMLGQAEMLRYAVEHFRRRKFNCGGSVIWQYNDCWPAPSWSAVDYYLRRKAHYYYIKRAYAPVIVSFDIHDDGTLSVWAVNDKENSHPCELRISRCDCRKLEEIDVRTFEMPANASAEITNISLKDIPLDSEFMVAAIGCKGRTIARSLHLGVLPKEFKWPAKQKLTLSHERISDTRYKVEISSDLFLKDVYCNIDPADPDAKWSDNFFDILPGEKAELKVRTSNPVEPEDFRRSLQVTHLAQAIQQGNK
ncbi:MAG: glycoside hydrolase family 2 protein [Victivallales bacterium]